MGADSIAASPGVSRFRDTCNVYVLALGRRRGARRLRRAAPCSTSSTSSASSASPTSCHAPPPRPGRRACSARSTPGSRVWVPPVEADLIAGVDEHWQRAAARRTTTTCARTASRCSSRCRSPGTVAEYRTQRYGGFDVYTLPTPGHTLGSVTYLVELDGRRLAFTGDLVYGDGQGLVARGDAVDVQRRRGPGGDDPLRAASSPTREPDVLLPSHGEPIDEPPRSARARRASGCRSCRPARAERRGTSPSWLAQPFEPITPHLLRNRTMLRDELRAALRDGRRAAHRLRLRPLRRARPRHRARRAAAAALRRSTALRRDHGVERIEAASRRTTTTTTSPGSTCCATSRAREVWAPENVAPVLERARRATTCRASGSTRSPSTACCRSASRSAGTSTS